MSVEGSGTTAHMQGCLERLNARDPAARAELLEHARRRLVVLSRRMFDNFYSLRRQVEVDDMLQEATLRLWQALEEVRPTNVGQFMGLAALQMRRALCDLSRHHFGRSPVRSGRKPSSVDIQAVRRNAPAFDGGDSTWNPHRLACWSEFHAAADRLREPERTAFDLIYYHELTQFEAANVMGVSIRQVRRYWLAARRQLHRSLEDLL